MKTFLLSLLILELFTFNSAVNLEKYYKEFMKSYGYKLEENPVTTPDGFILSVWHLYPHYPNGKVAFLQHGVSDTAWTFFQLGRKSLPFLLLKEGYDVWLGNTRGNIFSSEHVSNDADDLNEKYNEHTIDDFVQYDLPTMLKYVKERTGVEKMDYVGHSQGSTIIFMLAMHNPELFESSIDHFAAVGTVPNIAHTHFTPIDIMDKLSGILKKVNILNYFSLTNLERKLVADFCKLNKGICKTLFEAATCIKPSGRIDYSEIYSYLYYFPGGVSKTNLLHWLQCHEMKQLVYYNPNFEKEKTAVPYNYENLKKWKVKALIARTDDDTFSSYEDVTELYNTIEDKSYVQILDLKNYGHFDCLSAESAIKDIFYPIVTFFNE